MYRFSPPHKENTKHRPNQYKINWLMLLKDVIYVYSENSMKLINTLCGQNEELLIVKAGGTYIYH
jgi:hypothetical protein